MRTETTRYALEVPNLASLILTHRRDGQIPGLKDFAAEDRPNAPFVFWSFRVMVGLGMLMLLLGLCGAWARWRRRLYESAWLARFTLWMGPSGPIAILAGWYVTEIGRQPWVVYGLMRTRDAVSSHSALTLSIGLVILVLMYLAIFGMGVAYVLRLVRHGPAAVNDETPQIAATDINRRPARPLSAVDEPLPTPTRAP